jgi:putative transposase
MTKELVIDALRMAWFRRRPPPGLIHHSDRGSQYCSHDFQKQLAAYGMLASMSRKGYCWDNATSESFFSSLKNERVSRYETRDKHEPTFLITSKFFITGVAATPRSALGARVPQQCTRHGSRSSPRPSWRPERCHLVPEKPMEGQFA